MWSSITQDPKRLSNLKQLKLVGIHSHKLPISTDHLSASDSAANPVTWRKELKLTTVVERQRKKLSTATASSSSTSTSYSNSSSRMPLTPFDLPRLDHRLSDLDEKLEVMENMMSARQQMFEVLSKDSNLLNCDLQKELRRNSESYQMKHSELSQAAPEAHSTSTLDLAHPESKENLENSPSQLPSSEPSNPSSEPALGWGEYFKKKIW